MEVKANVLLYNNLLHIDKFLNFLGENGSVVCYIF